MSLSFIIFNQFGRARSGWRLLIFVALFFVLTVILATLAKAVFDILGVSADSPITHRVAFMISSAIFLLAAIFIGWVCAKGIEGLPFRSLGWGLGKPWLRCLFFGLLFGAGSLLLAAGVAACGGLSFTVNKAADSGAIINTVLFSAVIFAVGAAGEEALFRGYPLQTFARAQLSWVAIVLTSVFFSVAHLDNPNVVSYFTFINTILAGLWFAAAYLKTRSLWFPFAMHWSWNWMMGAILGIPVSGIKEITPHSVWQRIDHSPTWLAGGDYGLEGGLACTIALTISTLMIWFVPFLKPTAEMLALTNQENPKVPASNQSVSIFNDHEV